MLFFPKHKLFSFVCINTQRLRRFFLLLQFIPETSWILVKNKNASYLVRHNIVQRWTILFFRFYFFFVKILKKIFQTKNILNLLSVTSNFLYYLNFFSLFCRQLYSHICLYVFIYNSFIEYNFFYLYMRLLKKKLFL